MEIVLIITLGTKKKRVKSSLRIISIAPFANESTLLLLLSSEEAFSSSKIASPSLPSRTLDMEHVKTILHIFADFSLYPSLDDNNSKYPLSCI